MFEWFFLLSVCSVIQGTFKHDIQALKYCLEHKNNFIAIIWPIAQGKNKKIKSILNDYGTIHYQKQLFFDLKNKHAHY